MMLNMIARYQENLRRLNVTLEKLGKQDIPFESVTFPLEKMKQLSELPEENRFNYHDVVFESYQKLFDSNLRAFFVATRYLQRMSKGDTVKEADRTVLEEYKTLYT